MFNRLVYACSLVIAGVTGRAFAFDPSDYRQDTYGPPTHYCDPARALNNNGAGTLVDPWNLNQAMNLAMAGNVVGFLPGVGVPMVSTDDDNIPTFNPANSGTINNRIVFVTRYAAVALPDVANNPGRTELRHDGTAPVANGQFEIGTGSPMYGSYGSDYITYDGFFVDMAQAYPMGDSGVIRADTCTGVEFRNFEIKGTITNMQSNAVIYRPQNAIDTVLSNFRVYDFMNDPTGSSVAQAALFSDQYGDQNFLIEHFEIRNTQRGIFLKGSAAGFLNYGTIRYGIVSDVASCYQFNALDTVNTTTLEYNVCYNVIANDQIGGGGITLSSETSPARNLLIHHNTVARVLSTHLNANGGFYSRTNGIASNVIIRDNIVDIDNGPEAHAIAFGDITGLPTVLDYNGYTKNGAALSWAFNGVQYDTLGDWRVATSRDANSFELAVPVFTDRNANDFTVVGGHAAKTASSTGGEIGAYASGAVIGVDLTGAVIDNTAPAAPSALTVL